VKTDLAPALVATRAATPAALTFARVAGKTVVTQCRAGSPLKLLVPRQNQLSAWAIAATFGGGLLAGDSVSLHVVAESGTRGLISTQASTKVYRSADGRTARQSLHASVGRDALLAVLPDPVVCFGAARYEQTQSFNLAAGASLLLLDSFTAGRIARGERWAMTRYRSENDIAVDGRRIARDAMELAGDIASSFRTGRFNCFATLFAVGPMLAAHTAEMMIAVRARKLSRNAELLATASPLADGCVLRFAGVDIEQTLRVVRQLISFVPELLGDDPFSRKW
jgi:urease accessory protein